MNDYNVTVNFDYDDVIQAQIIDLNLNCVKASEIRKDITIPINKCVTIWGYIKSNCGYPISNSIVKLIKVCTLSSQKKSVAYTTSNYEGFYQFQVYSLDSNFYYEIVTCKEIHSTEKILKGIPCDEKNLSYNDIPYEQNQLEECNHSSNLKNDKSFVYSKFSKPKETKIGNFIYK